MPDIFLSYSTVNRDFVLQLKRDLDRAAIIPKSNNNNNNNDHDNDNDNDNYDNDNESGSRKSKHKKKFTVWMDNYEIKGGDEWVKEIETNLQRCRIVIVAVSKASNQSTWVRRETIRAEQLRKKRIPLLIEHDCGLPLHLLDLQYIDFRTNEGYQRALEDLVTIIERHLKKEKRALMRKHGTRITTLSQESTDTEADTEIAASNTYYAYNRRNATPSTSNSAMATHPSPPALPAHSGFTVSGDISTTSSLSASSATTTSANLDQRRRAMLIESSTNSSSRSFGSYLGSFFSSIWGRASASSAPSTPAPSTPKESLPLEDEEDNDQDEHQTGERDDSMSPDKRSETTAKSEATASTSSTSTATTTNKTITTTQNKRRRKDEREERNSLPGKTNEIRKKSKREAPITFTENDKPTTATCSSCHQCMPKDLFSTKQWERAIAASANPSSTTSSSNKHHHHQHHRHHHHQQHNNKRPHSSSSHPQRKKNHAILCRRCELDKIIKQQIGPELEKYCTRIHVQHTGRTKFLSALVPSTYEEQRRIACGMHTTSSSSSVCDEQSSSSSSSPSLSLFSNNLTLDGYTRASWSFAENTTGWQFITFRCVVCTDAMKEFLEFLKKHKKSAYGTFWAPKQPNNNRMNNNPQQMDGLFCIPHDQAAAAEAAAAAAKQYGYGSSKSAQSTFSKTNALDIICKYAIGLGLDKNSHAITPRNNTAVDSTLHRSKNDPATTNGDVQGNMDNDDDSCRSPARIPEDYMSSSMLGALLSAQRKNENALAIVPKGSVKQQGGCKYIPNDLVYEE